MAISTYLSFFAGIGGLDLAVRLAVPEAHCIGYVEIEVPAVGILAARMEDGSMDQAPVWSDIRTFPAELYRGRVAGAVFGFPCTDLSVAGKQAGLEGGTRSGLFYDAMRIVREVGCEWCFLENVPPVLAFPAGLAVLRELAESGFDAEWLSLRAADVGASHRRERVFILAYRESGGLRVLRESSRRAGFVGGATRNWTSPNARDADKWHNRSSDEGRQQNLSGQTHNWPTLDANAINDGNDLETWEQRRQRQLEKGINGNGMGPSLAIKASQWTTPQAHDASGGDPERVRRKGTEHGCANLADDVTKWGNDE